MDTNAHESDLTEAVIGASFEVANVLGAGFLEKVYERALIRELSRRRRTAARRRCRRSFSTEIAMT
jgi:GxxExxY protein